MRTFFSGIRYFHYTPKCKNELFDNDKLCKICYYYVFTRRLQDGRHQIGSVESVARKWSLVKTFKRYNTSLPRHTRAKIRALFDRTQIRGFWWRGFPVACLYIYNYNEIKFQGKINNNDTNAAEMHARGCALDWQRSILYIIIIRRRRYVILLYTIRCRG